MERWKRQDLLKKCSLASHTFGFICSFLAFFIMANNNHGDWGEFDHYEEYRYLVSVSVGSTLYSGLQSLRLIQELYTSRTIFLFPLVDFGGDQMIAYLLISSASSAIPLTNRMREGADNAFTDASAAAISMAIFAFVSLAISSLISGYKLSNSRGDNCRRVRERNRYNPYLKNASLKTFFSSR